MGTLTLKVSDDMSKAEEVQVLEKLEKFFRVNPNNYLAGLFKTDFSIWAARRMADDFTLDVMEYVNDLSKEQEIAELRGKLEDSEAQAEILKDEREALQQSFKALNENLSAEKEEGRNRLVEYDEIAVDLRRELDETTTHFLKGAEEIRRLKAILFDAHEQGFTVK